MEAALLFPIVLTSLGVTISFLLLHVHAGNRTFFCPSKAGCEAVLSSKYSTFVGIPLPWMGVGAYLVMLGLFLLAFGTTTARLRIASLGIALWLSVAGVSFSAVLMFLQFAVLHAFCPLCTASAFVMAALVFSTTRADRLAATTEFAGRRASALAIGCVVLLAAIPSIASALPANDEVLATVDGESFTRTQMESEIGVSLEPLRHSIYQLEIAWVQKRVDDALLASEAKAKGMKVEELLATRSKDRARLLNELAQTHRVELFLRAPKVRWLKIDLSTAKLAGPVDAPVQIVVFSDFQCRFCAQLAGVLKRIRAEFPETVLIAYRYFPLENHPRAMPAAVAAECAAEQGKFWEYHDRLFAEGGDLTNTEFLNVARTLGLDGERFRECQNADRSRNIVEMSRKDAEDHGLEGAPTIALNGRIIGGMVSYERLVAEVRKELTVITRQKPSQ